jgi:ATPases of the AAA+ class
VVQIVAVCDEAALSALENNLEAAYVSHQDFLTALQLVKPRTPPQLIKLYENYIKKWDQAENTALTHKTMKNTQSSKTKMRFKNCY